MVWNIIILFDKTYIDCYQHTHWHQMVKKAKLIFRKFKKYDLKRYLSVDWQIGNVFGNKMLKLCIILQDFQTAWRWHIVSVSEWFVTQFMLHIINECTYMIGFICYWMFIFKLCCFIVFQFVLFFNRLYLSYILWVTFLG